MLSIEYAVTMTVQPDNETGIAALKAKLSDYVNRVLYRRDVIWITKNGRRVAAVMPVELAEAALAAQRGATVAEISAWLDQEEARRPHD